MITSDFRNYLIDTNNFSQGNLINEGKFGNLYHGVWEQTIPIVVKVFHAQLPPHLNDELNLYFQIRHPNILSVFGLCRNENPEKIALVIEKMDTSLEDKIKDLAAKSIKFDLDQIENIAESMTNGLFHLHEKKILYGHLKATNVLFNKQNEVKLSDFALVKFRIHISQETKNASKGGTVRWRTPESFKRNFIASEAEDIYSLGMLFWQLFAMKKPYVNKTETEVLGLLQDKTHETIPQDCPKLWADLIQKCWNFNLEQRPTALQVKNEIIKIIAIRKEAISVDLHPGVRIPVSSSTIQKYITGS